MNVYTLFETRELVDIEMSIQRIKDLNTETEFQKYSGRSLSDYEIIFKGLIKPSFDYLCNDFAFCDKSPDSIRKFTNWLDIDNLSPTLKKHFLFWHPEYLKYFDLNKFCVVLLTEFDLSKLTKGFEVAHVLKSQPQLIDYFDLSLLESNDIALILEHQPQLVDKL